MTLPWAPRPPVDLDAQRPGSGAGRVGRTPDAAIGPLEPGAASRHALGAAAIPAPAPSISAGRDTGLARRPPPPCGRPGGLADLTAARVGSGKSPPSDVASALVTNGRESFVTSDDSSLTLAAATSAGAPISVAAALTSTHLLISAAAASAGDGSLTSAAAVGAGSPTWRLVSAHHLCQLAAAANQNASSFLINATPIRLLKRI